MSTKRLDKGNAFCSILCPLENLLLEQKRDSLYLQMNLSTFEIAFQFSFYTLQGIVNGFDMTL